MNALKFLTLFGAIWVTGAFAHADFEETNINTRYAAEESDDDVSFGAYAKSFKDAVKFDFKRVKNALSLYPMKCLNKFYGEKATTFEWDQYAVLHFFDDVGSPKRKGFSVRGWESDAKFAGTGRRQPTKAELEKAVAEDRTELLRKEKESIGYTMAAGGDPFNGVPDKEEPYRKGSDGKESLFFRRSLTRAGVRDGNDKPTRSYIEYEVRQGENGEPLVRAEELTDDGEGKITIKRITYCK